MIKSPSFSIYSAAAGSGKTFTLVKEYLKIILKAPREDYYKHLLAITFTNRAVKEMKERIVSNLISFSSSSIIENPSVMILQVINETELNLVFIQKKSKKILNYLLNNYSSFSVETIDSFNHRLIRTFARDLKLSGNFEVSLDVEKLLNEAVELLISKAGEHKEITKTILQFSFEKIDEDKSWDISKEVAEVAKLIFNENSIAHLEVLKSKLPVGSSAKIKSVSAINALAIDTLCCSPPDSSFGKWSDLFKILTSFNIFLALDKIFFSFSPLISSGIITFSRAVKSESKLLS